MVRARKRGSFNPFDLWSRFGITEHPGGAPATRRLLEMCGIQPGQLVLDVGCGTGYTACLLAKQVGATVVGVDITPGVLDWARRRVAQEGAGDRVTLVAADTQNLPFQSETFDAVIAESVIVFCDAHKADSEAYRVLRRGGAFGDNELTYLKPPPDRLRALFAGAVFGAKITPMLAEEWKAAISAAGFPGVWSTVQTLSFWEQLKSHLEVDGLRKYLSRSLEAMLDPTVLRLFFRRDVLADVFRLLPYLGYGLYMARRK